MLNKVSEWPKLYPLNIYRVNGMPWAYGPAIDAP